MNIVTIGMDLSDKKSEICGLAANGEIVLQRNISNTRSALRRFFSAHSGVTVAIETGTHSPWISRELESLGCRVLVGNARRLRAIWSSDRKSDTKDAEMLARIARFDPKLLSPIQHRNEESQLNLSMVKSRDMLVQCRSKLVNSARCISKSLGERVPSCSAQVFAKKARENLPEKVVSALSNLLDSIEMLSDKIRKYDRDLEAISTEKYPETQTLQQIAGVGPITALAFVLTLEDPNRFEKNRTVGAFLGLVPKRDQSGNTDKELRITKAGNTYLRRLLVGAANYVLGAFGPDCNLRCYGQRIIARGSGTKKAKKRAVVAVARKLSVLMMHLWKTGETYQPLFGQQKKEVA